MCEEWRGVVGLEDYYQVSDFGRVQSTTIMVRGPHGSAQKRTGRELKPDYSGSYPTVALSVNGKKKTYRIHNLVLEAFVGPRPTGMVARHFPDRDTSNNRLDNLSWATKVENEGDKESHGTLTIGECNGCSKLTLAEVRSIRRLLSEAALSHAQIASMFRVSRTVVTRIASGKRWGKVDTCATT